MKNEKLILINARKASLYSEEKASLNIPLSEDIVKKAHAILIDGVGSYGGIYRNSDRPISIGGTSFEPPEAIKLPFLLKSFFEELNQKTNLCGMPEVGLTPIELACWTHAEFVCIHPFADGNGRISRLMMNYQLIQNGYFPINILESKKEEYFNCLKRYQGKNNIFFDKMPRDLTLFTEFVKDEQIAINKDLTNAIGIQKNIALEPEIDI